MRKIAKLTRWSVSIALAGAAAAGGLTLPGPASATAGTGAAAPAAVRCQPAERQTEGQTVAGCSGGVFPAARCREQLAWYWQNGYPNAKCAWHPPLAAGYEELTY